MLYDNMIIIFIMLIFAVLRPSPLGLILWVLGLMPENPPPILRLIPYTAIKDCIVVYSQYWIGIVTESKQSKGIATDNNTSLTTVSSVHACARSSASETILGPSKELTLRGRRWVGHAFATSLIRSHGYQLLVLTLPLFWSFGLVKAHHPASYLPYNYNLYLEAFLMGSPHILTGPVDFNASALTRRYHLKEAIVKWFNQQSLEIGRQSLQMELGVGAGRLMVRLNIVSGQFLTVLALLFPFPAEQEQDYIILAFITSPPAQPLPDDTTRGNTDLVDALENKVSDHATEANGHAGDEGASESADAGGDAEKAGKVPEISQTDVDRDQVESASEAVDVGNDNTPIDPTQSTDKVSDDSNSDLKESNNDSKAISSDQSADAKDNAVTTGTDKTERNEKIPKIPQADLDHGQVGSASEAETSFRFDKDDTLVNSASSIDKISDDENPNVENLNDDLKTDNTDQKTVMEDERTQAEEKLNDASDKPSLPWSQAASIEATSKDHEEPTTASPQAGSTEKASIGHDQSSVLSSQRESDEAVNIDQDQLSTSSLSASSFSAGSSVSAASSFSPATSYSPASSAGTTSIAQAQPSTSSQAGSMGRNPWDFTFRASRVISAARYQAAANPVPMSTKRKAPGDEVPETSSKRQVITWNMKNFAAVYAQRNLFPPRPKKRKAFFAEDLVQEKTKSPRIIRPLPKKLPGKTVELPAPPALEDMIRVYEESKIEWLAQVGRFWLNEGLAWRETSEGARGRDHLMENYSVSHPRPYDEIGWRCWIPVEPPTEAALSHPRPYDEIGWRCWFITIEPPKQVDTRAIPVEPPTEADTNAQADSWLDDLDI